MNRLLFEMSVSTMENSAIKTEEWPVAETGARIRNRIAYFIDVRTTYSHLMHPALKSLVYFRFIPTKALCEILQRRES